MNDKLKQFVGFGVCSVVALALCLVVLVITVNNLGGNSVSTEDKTIVNKTELESSKETLVEYINKLVLKTNDRFVKAKTYTDVSVDDITVLNETVTKDSDIVLLNFAKDKMFSVIDSYYDKDTEGAFEKDDSKKLALVLKEDLLESANFTIGQVDENGESIFDDNGNVIDEGFYCLAFDIKGESVLNNKELSEMFSVKNDLLAKKQFINDIKSDCLINKFESKPQKFSIKAMVNRENDEIEYIKVIRNYNVTIEGEFVEEAAFFGKKTISFIYTVTDVYEYSYAGISFVEDEITIGFDEEYMLNVNAVIDDDSEYSVEFSSSDEDVAFVDEMGYVKGLKNCDVPTIITVKLNYLGETFTDTCVVNVSEE